MKEMVGGCCVCSDERGWDENPLVYCDGSGCEVAVHQACYGIVTVPTGNWYCRKCESNERPAKMQCELCPSKEGAFKRTDSGGWAHVVCALYIPEVRFGNVTTMEPIQVSLIPPERFNKTCYVCDENNRENKKHQGAFMQCNKPGCKHHFHVTCAQFLGLLCEEAGNMQDNVKYCGYCNYHYSKLKKTSNLKIIPPYKPIPNLGATDSPTSSPEKSMPKGSSEPHGSVDGQNLTGSGNGGNSTVGGGPSNISPEVNNGSRNTGGRGSANKKNAGNSKSGSNGSSNSASPSPIPRIQPGNLFSSGAFSSSLNSKTPSTSPVEESSAKKGKGPSSVKSNDDEANGSNDGGGGVTMKSDANKSHGTSSSGSVLPAPFGIKNKDFSSVSMNDVVTAALDRPMPAERPVPSKFGRGAPTASVIEGMNTSGGNSASASRCDKPPPDIKPHVTLTPIPMRSDDPKNDDGRSKASSNSLNFSSSFAPATTKLGLSQEEVNRDLRQLGMEGMEATLEKSSPAKRSRPHAETYDSETDSATEEWPEREESQSNSQTQYRQHFSRIDTYNQINPQLPLPRNSSRMLTSAQANEMSNWEANSGKPPMVNIDRIRVAEVEGIPHPPFGGNSEFPHKRGPGRPAKPRSGASRDDEPRKTPAKRGRRGSASTSANNFSRGRESLINNASSNGVPMDETSYDEPANSPNNTSGGRGGRHAGPGRKPVPSPSTNAVAIKKPNYDDSSTPTMSQLKAQMATAAAAGTSDKTSVLPSHMFGNVINPTSSMAQRLVDNLSQEIEMANQGGGVSDVLSPQTAIVGIPFPGKTKPNTATGTNGLASKPGASGQPQTLEELLERQWEQGSQFLMEQAQHLDIAQLLSCLNQLKQDNKALEDHVASLCQRKEQLTAINARLSIPLGSSASLSLVSQGFANNGTTGSSALAIQGSKNSSAPAPTPHQQLQHQIQQESVLQQGRMVHQFPPGNNMPGHSHGQGHHGSGGHGHGHGHGGSHGHRGSVGSNSSQGQVYGYPGHGGGGHGPGSSGQVGASHPSPHLTNNSHNSNHSHSSHPPRDSR